MWRLHRYYLRELAINAAITFTVLFAVVLVSLIYRGIQRSQGGSPLDAARITLYFALDSLAHLLTISFLIATVLTYTRAAQDRELIAIRAAGLAPRVPMMPALLMGLFLSVGASFANHVLIPEVHFRKYRVVGEVLRSAIINLGLAGDRIQLLDSGYVMTYTDREGDEVFRGCTVYTPKPLTKGASTIMFVDKVSLLIDENLNTLQVRFEGTRDPINNRDFGAVIPTVPLDEIGSRSTRLDGDADIRSDQLLAEVMRGVHRNPTEATYTLLRRCVYALMPALLAPLGYCIAELARMRGRVIALVLALVPLATFYLGDVFGARLMVTTDNPLSAWLPVLLLAAFGGPLMWRQLRR
ncbi:MAG: LptF/LptG family permease [Planctomycetota bacterium]